MLWPNDRSIIKTALISFAPFSMAIFGSFYLSKRYKYYKEYKRLLILRENRILSKSENLSKLSVYLDDKIMNEIYVDDIVDKSIGDLLTFLKSDTDAQDKVFLAYQKKAFEVNSRLNCVVEFLHIDKSEINSNGPLYGVPISIKDNFLIKGYRSCAGCSVFIDKPVRTNSVLIDVLKDLGAVPFVKTVVPQTMMSILSSNPIDGVVLNPINNKMSPGGSSSGEAALVGGRGSLVGIGTDIGGSVRLPAAFCGVVGFKPTVNRLSKKGLLEITRYTLVTGCCGILGRDVATVSCLFRHIVNSQLHRQLDPTVVPIDFNTGDFESKKKLKIGYFIYDGSYRVVPAAERAVLKAVRGLIRGGHEVVHWQPPVIGEHWLGLFLSGIAANKGEDAAALCKYDELDSGVKHFIEILNWNFFQYLYNLAMCKMFGLKDFLIWVKATRALSSAMDVMGLLNNIKTTRDLFINDLMKQNIDVLICPTSGFVAPPVKPKGSITGMLTYQNLWNLIDFPAGTVPVTHVTHTDISDLLYKYPKTKSMWHRNTFENQKESLYLPVSVQCVTMPWKEELCLRIMKEIEENVSMKD